jgi:hypothetical protein
MWQMSAEVTARSVTPYLARWKRKHGARRIKQVILRRKLLLQKLTVVQLVRKLPSFCEAASGIYTAYTDGVWIGNWIY